MQSGLINIRTALRGRTATAFVLGSGLLFAAGVLLEVPYLNGPWYWRWPWRDLGVLHTALRLLPGLVPLAWALRRMSLDGPRTSSRDVLALLTVACLLHQISGFFADPAGYRLLRDIVASPGATSYYTDALPIRSTLNFLAGFHSTPLHLHSSTHPPGPILYYRLWIWILGPEAGAYAGGSVLLVLAAAGVPAVHAFARLWTSDPLERLHAAALYSMLPGLLLISPEFDQIYPLFTMGIVGAWVLSMDGQQRAALALGAVLFVALLFAYNLLTIGAFLALHAGALLWRRPDRRATLKRILATSAVALGVCAGLFLLLHLATGYRPLASFVSALDTQARLAGSHGRPWLACVFFDPYDFALGAGIMAVPLALIFTGRTLRRAGPLTRAEGLSLLGFATIAVVDVSGLLRAETARVWLFLQPFLVIPAALVLARWKTSDRAAFFALQWLIVVVLKAKMAFVIP
jgi:hypothetical protein